MDIHNCVIREQGGPTCGCLIQYNALIQHAIITNQTRETIICSTRFNKIAHPRSTYSYLLAVDKEANS